MEAGKKIVFNTIVMYCRICITMLITLLSSRWILLALGKEDFGIYSLIAGLMALLMFLNLTMATASQRFLSYAMGKNNEKLLKDTFFYSLILHFIIGCVIFIIVEIAGQYLISKVLIIPTNKIEDAIFILHCLSISSVITVWTVPFNSILIAHENIVFVAIIQIIVSSLKLATAIILLYYSYNRLRLYALCMTAITIILFISYFYFCKRRYKETRITFNKQNHNYKLLKELISYICWNLIGAISSLFRTQGVSILMNTFYGVIVNTAYGIATQVNGQLTFFSKSIVTASRPQIVKSEGMNNRERMLNLSMTTCKASFLLISIITIPLLVEMPYVLSIWLKIVPEYSIQFTRLIILFNIVAQISIGISIMVESVGKIKYLQILVGGLHFFVLPIGYFMLKHGYSPGNILLMVIIEECVSILIMLPIANKVCGLDISKFIKSTILPCCLTFGSAFSICYYISTIRSSSIGLLILLMLTSFLCVSLLSYIFVWNKKEKFQIAKIVKNTIRKYSNK